MTASAILKNVRMSNQKIKYTIDKVRGLKISKAIDILTFSNKKSAYILKKLILSAKNNAEKNDKLDIDKLYIHKIYVTKARNFKRLNIRARGKTDKIIKKNSHIFIYVKEQE